MSHLPVEDKVYILCQYKVDLQAGVAKLGQRRKIQGLILSGSGVQIPSPALLILLIYLSTIPCYS